MLKNISLSFLFSFLLVGIASADSLESFLIGGCAIPKMTHSVVLTSPVNNQSILTEDVSYEIYEVDSSGLSIVVDSGVLVAASNFVLEAEGCPSNYWQLRSFKSGSSSLEFSLVTCSNNTTIQVLIIGGLIIDTIDPSECR